MANLPNRLVGRPRQTVSEADLQEMRKRLILGDSRFGLSSRIGILSAASIVLFNPILHQVNRP